MHSKEPWDFIIPLLKTPRIFAKVVKSLYVKHIKAQRDYEKSTDGTSSINIQQISIKITNACNLRCKTCGQWGETGYNLGKPTSELKKIVPLERYLKLADNVKKDHPIYYIWGGEPFLYPNIMDFTARIKENKSILAVVTNATMLKSCAKEIVSQGWDVLMFSLDGPEDIHDKIRGKKGTFQKVADGIQEVQKCKKDMRKKLPWIIPLVTVSVDNAAWLDKIFETGKILNADCIGVYYSWFTNRRIGEAHTKIFQEKLGITPTAWQGYLFDHNVDTDALQGSLNRIRATKWGFPYIFVPNLKDEQLSEYYKNPGNFFGFGPCISPWYVTELMPNGDVAPCRDYPDYVTGNLMESSIYDIWNGEKYRKFRKVLKENGGTFPICARCCGLMGW